MSTLPQLRIHAARVVGWDTYAGAMVVEVLAADLSRAALLFSPGLVAALAVECERDENVRGWLATERAKPETTRNYGGPISMKARRAALAFMDSGHLFRRGALGRNQMVAKAVELGIDPAEFKRALNSERARRAKGYSTPGVAKQEAAA